MATLSSSWPPQPLCPHASPRVPLAPGSSCQGGAAPGRSGSSIPVLATAPADPAPGAGGAGRSRGDISREKGAGGGIRHCRPGSAGPAPQTPCRQHGKPGPVVRAEPGGAAEDRPAVRPRAGAGAGALDPGTVWQRWWQCGGTASARQGWLPAVAEGWHSAVPAHQQPPPTGTSARGQNPGVGHGLQADGADLAVPAGRRALWHRGHRHLPDRGSLGREEHGVRAEDPDEPGQPGRGQGRWALRGRPQLVPQEVAGEPARLLRGQAEGGAERHRAADGHQPGRLAGWHDGLWDATPDPLSPPGPPRPLPARATPHTALTPTVDQPGAPRPGQLPPHQFCQDQSHFLLLLFGWVGAVLLHPHPLPTVPLGAAAGTPSVLGSNPCAPINGSSSFQAWMVVTSSSDPVVISQGVPKHPRELPSLKPKLKTIRIITKDLIRDLVIPQEKPQPCLIIGKKEYEKIKESARSPTEEERWDRLKTLKARQDAAFEALKKAQSEELRKAELQNERERQRDVEEEKEQQEKEQQEKQQQLQQATRMRLEQEEEMRELTSLFLHSKCNMIRDKQILEKQMIRKELAEEEKRLDKMMEMEWEKGAAVQEELERQRKQEMMRARQDLVKQMEQNAEKRALRDEEKYQEGQKLLEHLEQMKREDRKAWEQKKEQQRQIFAEIQHFNTESQRLKDQQREQERLEDERVLEQQRQKAEREAALEAEQERLRLEKEKELARLRAKQERARDWQAERDALMAKRSQEAADREWRRQELENARKKAELEQRLRRDRLEQVAQKEQYLAMQVEQDRQEFQRVLKVYQEQLEREKLQREQRELQQRAHAEDLRRQIQEMQQQRERERAAFIEEGRQQEQEAQQRNQRLAQLGQQKLQEFRATGMPDKYCAQVERKARRRANAALS